MSDPWAFGWTQVFTILGFLITIGIAFAGFRTFERWKREKIEEKRIDTAIDALALAYESKFIFDNIRSELAYEVEWDDMPGKARETEQQRSARGPFYAIFKRIQANKDFFERAWKLQVRCTAVFGPEVEDIFLLLHKARREVEVSAEMLLRSPYPEVRSQDNVDTWDSFRADVWPAYGSLSKHGDRVGLKLSGFKEGIERLCRPIFNRELKQKPKGVFRGISAHSNARPRGHSEHHSMVLHPPS